MPRAYASPVRDAQRVHTRRRVINAAHQRFSAHGYTATTLRAVAKDAGVSLERVTAVGNKPALLLAVIEDAINDGELIDLTARSDIAAAWASDSLTDILAALVSFVVASNQRLDSLMTAWAEARGADPDLADAYRQRMNQQREAGRDFVTQLIGRGLIAPGTDPISTADRFWAAAHPTQYELLVHLAGWSSQRYAEHLLCQAHQLMPPAEPT